MHKLSSYIVIFLILAFWQNNASAGLKFGNDEKIRFVANTTLQGPNGERLYLARKVTMKSFLLPYTIEDNGFIFGVSGDSQRYFQLPQGEQLAEIQKAGHLPTPLPQYALDPLDRLFGHSLWIALTALGVYGGYKAISRKLFAKKDAPATGKKHVSPYSVTFNDQEISTFFEGKPHETISWGAILGILIQNKEQGFLSVPYWYVSGKDGGIVFPSDAIGHEQLLNEFKSKLPGYHNAQTYRAITDAMGAQTGSFIVWERG